VINASFEFFDTQNEIQTVLCRLFWCCVFVVSFSGVIVSIKDIVSDVMLHLASR